VLHRGTAESPGPTAPRTRTEETATWAGEAVEEAPADTMQVRLWNPSTGNRYPLSAGQVDPTFWAGAPHLVSHPRYVPNGIDVLDRIRVSRDLAGRRR
jgi:hypothetical protein